MAERETELLYFELHNSARSGEYPFTDFYDLGKMTACLKPKELTIIAASPGVGKTTFALQMVLNMAMSRFQSTIR